ncbi:ABC-type nitrate/sulfonate transport system, permease component [Arthrobacter crystallopoietes BAB-32]|uniref:ABC-type nitrate/sulfonate transport system, permease component n=1 Tax=Arthrobacter crystallopoietes BAB-32 TaxID=1246476 RepID=N1V9R4_9MICC|nr:ABC transporter permease [Arthrobacter crystallopoietes]EMY35028.1 ABC-type nitrate/sulfonate transport system, permease component [Arthrobacter crystallopoietes BAB-32]
MNRKLTNWALGVGTPFLLVAAWWMFSENSTNTFFPPLGMILERFQALWLFEHFESDVMLSLRNLVVGYALATVIGVGLGFVTALMPVARWALDPLIHFLRGIPPVALVPIFISLIGFGIEMRLVSITLAAMFPTLIATVDGIRSVDSTLKDVSSVYRLTRAEKLAQVYLPAAGPQIASGMQVSLQVAFVVMIASEMLGSSQGIGAMTLLAQQSFMTSDMWAGILLLGVIGFGANLVFEVIKNKVLAWYVGSKRLARS